MEYDKNFIVLGNMSTITYKEVWPLIQGGHVWLGVTANSGEVWFNVPDDYDSSKNLKVDESGRLSIGVGVRWFTNLDHSRRHEEIVLGRTYSPERYPTYDNYDAIEVSKVVDIPKDYAGVMGVPITFLGKHNPDQFEIVGYSRKRHAPEHLMIDSGQDHSQPYVQGKAKYDRIFIRNLKPEGAARIAS